MKSKIAIYIVISMGLVVTFWSLLAANSYTSRKISSSNIRNFSLKVKSNKETFLLGEIVKLEVEVANISENPITVRYGTVENGYLQIFISRKQGNYNELNGPDWGRKESGYINLDSGKSFKSETNLLWNQSPQVLQSNDSESRVQTKYAFPKSGFYFVKATLTSGGENLIKIESEPIQIIINEPLGDDLKIWNKIKDNGEFAYFMQQGDFLTSKSEEREELRKEVEDISTKYPNSILAGQMKISLEKYYATEARRKEFRQQIQDNNKNL